MKNFILSLCMLMGISVTAQVTQPFVIDFENRTAGSYTTAMAQQDFPLPPPPNYDYWYHGMDQGRSEIVDESGNKVLRVKYPQGCVGVNDPGACGIQIKFVLPETAKTMWVSYRLKFESGFDFKKGGKLPGLCGGKCYTGGVTPSVGDGWSARIMWRVDGKAEQYMYFTDQAATYGDDMYWDEDGTQRYFTPGTWHTVLTQIVLNDVPPGSSQGEKNGIVRSWFDGELALEVDTLRLVDFSNQTIDKFYISTFHGGSDATWAPSYDSYIRYDDFWISATAPEDPTSLRNDVMMWNNITDGMPLKEETDIISYPNPAVDELHIQAYKPIQNIQIFSLLGKLMAQTAESVIGVREFSSGVYYLYVTFEDGTTSKTKFLKP